MAENDPNPDSTRCWEDLPGAVLCHLLVLAPYKRADVKRVCQAWRAAVNASLHTLALPARDLDLLPQLTAMQDLTVTGEPAAGAKAGSINPWSRAHPGMMQRLRRLHLQRCPTALHQLAAWQAQQMAALAANSSVSDHSTAIHSLSLSSSTSSSSSSHRPGLDGLQELQLSEPGDIAASLPLLLTGAAWQDQDPSSSTAGDSSSGSGSRGAACKPWPLQHLSSLHIRLCKLTGLEPELSVLQQLPALQSLQLCSCHALALPAVSGCIHLTALRLGGNSFMSLPPEVSCLQHLQVLDLSCCSRLASVGSSLSCLTALTELNLEGPSLLFRDFSAAAAAWEASGAGAMALPHEKQLALLPELAQLSHLARLVLRNNRDLRVLPASLSALSRLQVLDASMCSLRFLTDELWECVGLRELLLSDNVLTTLPEEISKLHQLEVLDVGSCASLWQLPTALLSLSQLRRLVLNDKAVDQGLVERLELRSPNPVDVEVTEWSDPWGAEDGWLETGEPLSSDYDSDYDMTPP